MIEREEHGAIFVNVNCQLEKFILTTAGFMIN